MHGVYPADLRDARTDADVREWGVERAVSAIVSPEFETVMDQEYNFLLDIERVMRTLAERGQEMLVRVRCAQGDTEECRVLTRSDGLR